MRGLQGYHNQEILSIIQTIHSTDIFSEIWSQDMSLSCLSPKLKPLIGTQISQFSQSEAFFWQESSLTSCPHSYLRKNCLLLNSRTPRDMKHFGNPKNENLLRGPKFYGENEFPVEMCISQLITEILSFFCFHKNFMTNLSFQIAKKPSRVQLFWRYPWIRLTPQIPKRV